MYWIDKDLLIWNTNNISGCSLKHLWWRNVNILLCWNILVFGIDVLSFDVVLLRYAQGGLSKSVSVQILWFDTFNISGVSWKIDEKNTWNFSSGFVFLERNIVFVDFVWDVASVAWDNVLESLTFEHGFYWWEVTIKLYLINWVVIYSFLMW